jgi:two-component system, sensor histidine kinase PdtaS
MKAITSIYFLAIALVFRACPLFGQADTIALQKEIMGMEERMGVDYPAEFKKMEALHQRVLASGCTGCKTSSHHILGKFFWSNGEYGAGLSHFKKAVSLATKYGDTKNLAETLDLIGITFYFQAYYDSAAHYFHKALKVYEQVNDTQGMITVLHNISLMHHRRGNFNKTIEYLFKEEKLKDQLPQSVHEIEALGAMGSLMIDSMYYGDEIKEELQALQTYQKQNDKRAMHRTYRNIGKAYRQLENYKMSARYFLKAAKAIEEAGYVPDWDLVGADYRQADMKDSSFYYHYVAKPYFPRMTRLTITTTLEMLGNAHRYFGNPDSAIYYYDAAIKMAYSMNNRITFTGIHRYLVNVYTQLRDFEKAEYHLKTGLALAKEIALIHEKNLYSEGKFLYETKGDYKSALYYTEKYRIFQDSINRAETAVNLTRMQAEFKTAKKVREVEELRQKSILHEAQIETKNLEISLAASVALVIAALGALYYSRYQQKKKTSEQLEHKNQVIEQQNNELQMQIGANEVLLSEIHHRVKNNLQIISSLINLKIRQVSPETGEVLNQLNGRIYSMGLIHEKLYKKEKLQLIRLDVYLSELGRYLIDSFEEQDHPIDLKLNCDPVEIEVDQALACGLICNELFTNSMKYAFSPDQHNRYVEMRLSQCNNQMELSVLDNGNNGKLLSENFRKSFGLRFVDQLVTSKLSGGWSVQLEKGFHSHIKVPLVKHGKN